MVKKFGGLAKAVVRDYIADLVDPQMTIFSLPHLNFMIESSCKRAVCCENDPEVFRLQLMTAPSNCEINFGNASDFIGKEKYDLIYLDLCGSLSREFFRCLDNYSLSPEGTIIITLLKAREHRNYTHLLKPNRIDGYENILKKYGLYLYQTVSYVDTSPMIVLFATQKKSKEITNYEIK